MRARDDLKINASHWVADSAFRRIFSPSEHQKIGTPGDRFFLSKTCNCSRGLQINCLLDRVEDEVGVYNNWKIIISSKNRLFTLWDNGNFPNFYSQTSYFMFYSSVCPNIRTRAGVARQLPEKRSPNESIPEAAKPSVQLSAMTITTGPFYLDRISVSCSMTTTKQKLMARKDLGKKRVIKKQSTPTKAIGWPLSTRLMLNNQETIARIEIICEQNRSCVRA